MEKHNDRLKKWHEICKYSHITRTKRLTIKKNEERRKGKKERIFAIFYSCYRKLHKDLAYDRKRRSVSQQKSLCVVMCIIYAILWQNVRSCNLNYESWKFPTLPISLKEICLRSLLLSFDSLIEKKREKEREKSVLPALCTRDKRDIFVFFTFASKSAAFWMRRYLRFCTIHRQKGIFLLISWQRNLYTTRTI